MDPGIRKYLVLLQDSLAIKFAPLGGAGDKGRTEEEKDDSDASLRGMILFKEFLAANEPCTVWNSDLREALANLEYKGVLLPSTILVGAVAPLHSKTPHPLTILKSAHARKVLRSPKSVRIEFLGEIEEFLADPVDPSNFIPLSDSICWAIHELTQAGEEAFVDRILGELGTTYNAVPPSKELLYQVLERLTQAQKVYQTPKGYFIQRPESASAIGKRSSLRRSNSLRNSIKKQERVTGCLPRRTFSLRGSPKKKKQSLAKSKSSDLNLSKESLQERRRKHKSFLKNLLPFRRQTDREGKNKRPVTPPCPESKEISTQTSGSLENLGDSFRLLTVKSSSPTLDSDSGRFTVVSEQQNSNTASPSSITSEELTRLEEINSPTPTTASSSYSYLSNNPYRRRYLNYHMETPLSSPSLKSIPTLPKYPPRPFERRQIYEKLHGSGSIGLRGAFLGSGTSLLQKSERPKPPVVTLPFLASPINLIANKPPVPKEEKESSVEVEVLLPLGKLINQVLQDFQDDKEKGNKAGDEKPKTEPDGGKKEVEDLFSFKSSFHTNTTLGDFKSEVDVDFEFRGAKVPLKGGVGKGRSFETVSYKPPLILTGSRGERESEIM